MNLIYSNKEEDSSSSMGSDLPPNMRRNPFWVDTAQEKESIPTPYDNNGIMEYPVTGLSDMEDHEYEIHGSKRMLRGLRWRGEKCCAHYSLYFIVNFVDFTNSFVSRCRSSCQSQKRRRMLKLTLK